MMSLADVVRSIEDDIGETVRVVANQRVYQRIADWLALTDDPAASRDDRAVARIKALELIAEFLNAKGSVR
jgi:hypothetical protein